MISEDEVRKLARLARLEVAPEYIPVLLGHLNSILEYIQKLDSVDTSGAQAVSHILDAVNVFRDDVVGPTEDPSSETPFGESTVPLQGTLPVESLLDNAPDHSGRYIRVPLVIE